jgi:nickel transport protein
VLEVWRALALALLLAVLPLTSAHAHKLRAFAYAEGEVIHGSVYFAGNVPVKGAHIHVIDLNGATVAETTSNAEGRFSVVVRERIDHRVVADAGDGHRSEYNVKAAELPESLPIPSVAQAAWPAGPAASPPPPSNAAQTEMAGDLEARIERAVARQIGPLREELANYDDKVRWHDVLGGLGYILGITGLGCWLIERRRRGR